MGYLHLFYEDYFGGEGPATNPQMLILNAKQKIKNNEVRQIRKRAKGSSAIENEFEKLYNIKESKFADIKIQQSLLESNVIMNNFDEAIGKLKILLKEGGDVSTAVDQSNTVIEQIDKILIKGAKTGGLGDSSYSEIYSAQQRMRKINRSLKWLKNNNMSIGDREELLKGIQDVQSNVSGYMLELSMVYAFLNANEKALGSLEEAMINIGGHSSEGVRIAAYHDPKLKQNLMQVKSALQNAKTQSGVDLLFNINSNTCEAKSSWVGFQVKNYKDIASIPIGLEKTLSELGIEKYYDWDFLVNLTGSLAGNRLQKYRFPQSRRANKNVPLTTQTAVDHTWASVKNSMRILMISDAIAGSAFGSMLDKIHYYIIRNKGKDSQIRVIAVSKILNKIADFIAEEKNNLLGINVGEVESSTRVSSRDKFWSINAEAFEPADPTGQTRSDEAYPQIQNLIKSTKINISLNFNKVFSTLT